MALARVLNIFGSFVEIARTLYYEYVMTFFVVVKYVFCISMHNLNFEKSELSVFANYTNGAPVL